MEGSKEHVDVQLNLTTDISSKFSSSLCKLQAIIVRRVFYKEENVQDEKLV